MFPIRNVNNIFSLFKYTRVLFRYVVCRRTVPDLVIRDDDEEVKEEVDPKVLTLRTYLMLEWVVMR